MKTRTLNLILIGFISLGISAQQKVSKTKQAIEVSKDVTIDLNTSYVEIEIETWNKPSIEIEAYLESSELSKAELEEAVKLWNLDIDGSLDVVSIKSTGSRAYFVDKSNDYTMFLKDLEYELAEMPAMPKMPKMPNMPRMPEMPEMPEFPELPELPEGISNINFDYEAYKRDGEAYLERWSKDYEKTYGKEFKEQMKAWAKKFGDSDYQKKMEKWGEQYSERFEGKWAKDMEKWGEEFGEQFGDEWAEKMEAWGERFGKSFEKDMEAWAKRFDRQMERESREIERRVETEARRDQARARGEQARALAEQARAESAIKRAEAMGARASKLYGTGSNSKIKKVIKIKMPKKAKLNMNVRHGELKFASVVYDLKADLAYAALTASEIDGGETSINISYAPVNIALWKVGELNLNYVDDAFLDSVEYMVMNSNSSNVEIGNLEGNVIIDGSFGELGIMNIAESFKNLNLILENSNAAISLPDTGFNLQFKGNRTRMIYGDQNTMSTNSTFNKGSMSSGKSIVINAKYSKVIME